MKNVNIARVIQTGLQKKWPEDGKDDCECEAAGWPFLVWGITEEGGLITICPRCKAYEWGQEFEEE